MFLLTRPASILSFWNKRRKKRDFSSRPQDCLGTSTWPSFHCFEHQLGLYDPTTQLQREIQKNNSLEGRTTTLHIYHTFLVISLVIFFCMNTIVNWVEWLWNPSDSFVICFCGPESAQRSKEFLSFWLYWPIKTLH